MISKIKKTVSILLSLIMVFSVFAIVPLSASAASSYFDLARGTLIQPNDIFSFKDIGSFKFADYDDPTIIHEVKGSDFSYNKATLSVTDGYYSFGSTKLLPTSVSPGGLLIADYDSTTKMATFGVQNITHSFDETTGTLTIGGSGVVPNHYAMTGSNFDGVVFTQSNLVKHLIIEATDMIAIQDSAFMAYNGGCVLEDVKINSTSSTPLIIEEQAVFYRSGNNVTVTVNAVKLATVTKSPVNNYGTPVNLIYNVEQPITFKKNALTDPSRYLTVTFPTHCKILIPGGVQFTDSRLQEEYDRLAEKGYEEYFWKMNSDLVEGTDYVLGDASYEELTPLNASLVVGNNNTALFSAYTITDESVNGTVTASVNGTDVTEAAADADVTLSVAPAEGYQFVSISAGDVSLTTVTEGSQYSFTMPAKNITVKAEFEAIPTYTVIWKNGETVLETDENVAQGTMPEYNGTTPVKDEDGDYIYTFKGWSPEVSAVTGDVTYTAVFDSFKKYVVFIKTPKGSSYNLTVTNNTTIAQIKADLADELGIPAAQQRLIFAGEELEDTKTLVDYNIQKEDTIHDVPKSYTVTWLNDDGATIDTTTVYYGDMPEYNGNTPVKDEDDDFTYTFAGWSPEVVAVTGDVEYTATFDAVAKYEAGYYVVGTMNNWAIDPAYKLAENPATEGEYMLNDLALTATDGIKIAYAEPGNGKVWYPDGMGNEMTFSTDGSYNIYFRPDGQGGDDWYNGLIYAKRNPPAESTAVIDLINALPTDVTLADAEQIEAARNAYDALTDDQKSFIDEETLNKLTDAETALAKATADKAAADAVITQINALPTDVTAADKAQIESARAAYEALTDDQKALVTNETLDKLTAAETALAKATADKAAADAVTAQINALPADVTVNDKDQIEAARAAYEALTDDQKVLITEETLDKLTAAETVIADREAAKAVEDMINALPDQITPENKQTFMDVSSAFIGLSHAQEEYLSEEAKNKVDNVLHANYFVTGADQLPEEITLDDKQSVTELRSYYDDASDDVKALISDEYMNKLVSAEQKIADLEAVKAVEDMIKALPAVEDITLNDKDAVNATYDAFGELTDDQVFLLDGDLFDDLLDALDKIQDLEAAKVVEDKIKALPDVILLEDKDDVEAARAAYDALEPEQKDLIDRSVVEKLEDAEEVIADREAAKAVEDQINALPDDITLADKAAVDAANEARMNLTPAQADYLKFSAIDKLFRAQDKIRDLEAAKAVEDMINALPTEVTVDDEEQIEAARLAYEGLTDDQKALVTPETLEKLTDAETALAEEQKAAADQDAADAVDDKIDSLPDEITLDDKADVEAARAAFDALTDEQKALVTPETLEKLAAAEKAIADLETAKAVEDKINALPDVILLEDKADVEDARAAYDALEPEQKDLIDLSVVEKLEDAEEVIADREAAKAVEDQINALPDDITLADKAAVDAADEARLNLTPAQADYLTFSAIDKLFKAQDKIRDLEAAKAVEDMINALPTDVTVDDEEQIEAARLAYDALTDDQKALVTPETLEKLTEAETTLDNIVLLGDVDGDGDVTSIDATMIQRYLVSMRNLSDKQIKAADIDGDGEATILDVTLIQRYLAGITVKYPINEYV